jgi:hypothetical protein
VVTKPVALAGLVACVRCLLDRRQTAATAAGLTALASA